LDPETEITVEFASRPLENEENSPLTAVTGLPNAESLYSLLAQGIKVHLVFDISHKVHGLCAARIELVLKVRPFFDDGGDFILVKISGRILQPRSGNILWRKASSARTP
jgi:hypothetical protein